MIKNASTLLSLASAGILTLSVAYDYAYLFRFGISFAEAPTTLSDHIRSSLVWAPIVFAGWFLAVVIEWITRRVEGGMTEKEIIESSSNPKLTEKIRESPKYGLFLHVVLVPVVHFFVTPLPLLLWTMTAIFGWYLLHDVVFGHPRILEKTSLEFLRLTRFFPPAIMLVAYFGYSAANSLITKANNEYVFAIDGEERQVVFARHFEKYFLIWDKENLRAEFISTDSVTAFHQINKKSGDKDERKNGNAGENNPRH
ncbi:MAG: hypothetical protein MPJ22_13665 [Pirellulales bacterium]|nr:hypothetical protein [Pirellulales bacterium]